MELFVTIVEMVYQNSVLIAIHLMCLISSETFLCLFYIVTNWYVIASTQLFVNVAVLYRACGNMFESAFR